VRSNQAFKDETILPVGVELPKASTHLKMLEKLQELFSDMDEEVQWVLNGRQLQECLGLPGEAELAKILHDKNLMV